MQPVLTSPASATVYGIPTVIFSLLIPVAGAAVFTYIIAKRLMPMIRAMPDNRLDRPWERIKALFKYAIAQYRQPRYRTAGILHIILFAGFVIISIRSIDRKSVV